MKTLHQSMTSVSAGLVLALASGWSGVQAQTSIAEGGVGLHFGLGGAGSYKRVTLSYETAPWWTTGTSEFASSHLDLTGEIGVSYWWSTHRPSHVWQFSAVPILRWWWTDSFFMEAGVGPSLFSRTRFSDRNLSTAFQFDTLVGLGLQLTPDSRLSFRVNHTSNAGIKMPNRGMNVMQLTYSYQF
jgi:lipid A 3-O-deacylase